MISWKIYYIEKEENSLQKFSDYINISWFWFWEYVFLRKKSEVALRDYVMQEK